MTAAAPGSDTHAHIATMLAQSVCRLSFTDFPSVVVERAKQLILDALGAMLAGSAEPVGRPMRLFLADVGGNPHCSAVGTTIRTSAPWAALANGTFCRALDYDPPQPGHHPAGANLPAALALAEKQQLSGWRLIEAFVAGVEVQARTALAAAGAPDHGQHRPHFGRGVVSTLSAAMAASKALSLDAPATAMAAGIAAAQTGGIDSAGTMCNPGDSGQAAARGVQAAMLAQNGFTARPDALEHRYGLRQFLGEGADMDALVRDFPRRFVLAEDGISLKKYPCQYPNHRHIDAILALYRGKPWRSEDIAAIDVHLVLMPGNSSFNNKSIFNKAPINGMDGKFSAPYTAAVAALDGKVTIESFTDEKRWSPQVVDLLPRVTVNVSSERSMRFNAMWTEVTIRLRNGEERRRRVDVMRGAAGGLPLTREERIEKFMDCALRAVSRTQAEELCSLIERLESLDDLEHLCCLLRLPATARSVHTNT